MYSMDNDIDHILVSEDALKAKVNELGTQISRDYAGKDLLLVSILKGSVVFMADLMRAVQIPCAIDFMVVFQLRRCQHVLHGPCQDHQGPGRRPDRQGRADR